MLDIHGPVMAFDHVSDVEEPQAADPAVLFEGFVPSSVLSQHSVIAVADGEEQVGPLDPAADRDRA